MDTKGAQIMKGFTYYFTSFISFLIVFAYQAQVEYYMNGM